MKIKRKGASTIDIIAVFTIVMAAIIGMGGYMKHAMAGRWTGAGATFSSGKQYDPRGFGVNGSNGGTLDCFIDRNDGDATFGHWIDENCYQNRSCDCTLVIANGDKLPEYYDRCEDCKVQCQNDADCKP